MNRPPTAGRTGAQRPVSARGRGGAPAGPSYPAAQPGPMRPPSAMNMGVPGPVPQSSYGYRPPSSGFMPRGQTSIGTANLYNFNAAQGIALSQQVNVSANPVGREGLMSMSQQSAASKPTGMRGRQVQDSSYYLGEMRSRLSLVNEEIMRLRHSYEKLQTDRQTMNQLGKVQEQLRGDIGKYEKELAELNLAIMSQDTDLEDVQQDIENLERANDRRRKEADRIFSNRQQVESETAQREMDLQKAHESIDYKLNQMPDSEHTTQKREHVWGLRNEISRMTEELTQKVGDAERMQREVDAHRNDVISDVNKHKLLQLEQHRSTLLQKVTELRSKVETQDQQQQQQQQQSSAQGQESRDAGVDKETLLAQVRQDNEVVEKLQGEIDDMRDEIADLRDRVMEQEEEEAGDERKQEEDEDVKKLEELNRKDQQLESYIEAFPEQMDRELNALRSCESEIVQLLDEISALSQKPDLPTVDRFEEMQDDLEFKEKQMEYSSETHNRLEAELNDRKGELEKIEALDEKIDKELKTISERMESMKNDLTNWKDMNEFKKQRQLEIDELYKKRTELQSRHDDAKSKLQQLSSKYDQEKGELAKDDTHASLEALLQQVKFYEQNNFKLKDYIADKGTESNYRSQRDEVERLTGELNNLIIAHYNR